MVQRSGIDTINHECLYLVLDTSPWCHSGPAFVSNADVEHDQMLLKSTRWWIHVAFYQVPPGAFGARVSKCVSQLFLALKPSWQSVNMLCCSRCLRTLPVTTCSCILQLAGQRAFYVEFILIEDWWSILILLWVYIRKWKWTLSKNVYVEFNFILQPWFIVCFSTFIQLWKSLLNQPWCEAWNQDLILSILNQAFFLNEASTY